DVALAAPQTVVRVGDGTAAAAGMTATIASNLVGAGGLEKTDLGTLILTGADTYAGGTQVDAGVLQIGNGGAAGSIGGDVQLGQGATLVFDRSDAVAFAGAISGQGALVKQGAGDLLLSGANSYGGGTLVAAGSLSGTVASLQGDIVDNAVVNLTAAGAGDVYAGAMTGTGKLNVLGSGTLVLTGANVLVGGTTVGSAVLQVGDGGTSGSLASDVALGKGATLAFDRSDSAVFGGSVSGAGRLVKRGAG